MSPAYELGASSLINKTNGVPSDGPSTESKKIWILSANDMLDDDVVRKGGGLGNGKGGFPSNNLSKVLQDIVS